MENLLHIFWALLFQSYHLEKLLVVKRFSCYRRWKARQLLRKIIKTHTHTFSSLLLCVLPWEPKAHSSLAVAGARYLHCNSPCFTNTNLNIQRVRVSVSVLQMKSWAREGWRLAQGHTEILWQSWKLKSNLLAPISVSYPPPVFSQKSFTLRQSLETEPWLLDHCCFLTFPPLEKNTFTCPQSLTLTKSVSEHTTISVLFHFSWRLTWNQRIAFLPLKVCAIVICKLRHCKGALCSAACRTL